MTFQDKISILVTFIAGFLIGGYLFLAGYLPTFGISEVGNQDVYEGLVITGDNYGVCAVIGNCLVFQVLGNGKYRAIYDVTGKKQVQEGVLRKPVRTKLARVLGASKTLASEAAPLTDPVCRYTEAGTNNYRFTIATASSTYALDTCKTAINYDGANWDVLKEVWNELATPKE